MGGRCVASWRWLFPMLPIVHACAIPNTDLFAYDVPTSGMPCPAIGSIVNDSAGCTICTCSPDLSWSCGNRVCPCAPKDPVCSLPPAPTPDASLGALPEIRVPAVKTSLARVVSPQASADASAPPTEPDVAVSGAEAGFEGSSVPGEAAADAEPDVEAETEAETGVPLVDAPDEPSELQADAPVDAPLDSFESCGCLSHDLVWRHGDTITVLTRSSAYTHSCRWFTHRYFLLDPAPCVHELSCDDAMLVNEALNGNEVQALLDMDASAGTAARLSYGRPTGNATDMTISIDDLFTIVIGQPCGGSDDCTDAPPGIAAFVYDLRLVEDTEFPKCPVPAAQQIPADAGSSEVTDSSLPYESGNP